MSHADKSILILEDQPIIALDIEQMMLETGFEKIIIITSCADAEKWLKVNIPDLAVIDVQLRDGVSTQVARMLVDNGVPFIVHSALGTLLGQEDTVFTKGTWVSKPGLPDQLAHVVRETLAAT